jgi:hypothetical protein
MKKAKRILMISLVAVGMIACSSSGERHDVNEAESAILLSENESSGERDDAVSGAVGATPQRDVVSSLAAEVLEGDTARRLIRIADLRFRVSDVANATMRIEDIVRSAGGFVVRTNLQSHVSDVTLTPLSADSVLESAYYTIGSEMVVRVPAPKLDTMLRSLVPLIDFLDYRHINVRDVELELRANRLRQQRHQRAALTTRSASGTGTSLSFTGDADDQRLKHLQRADEAEMANISLEDQIRYSTITINIYQRPDIRRTVLADEMNISAYTPGAGSLLCDAFETGWKILLAIMIFFTRLWGVFLLGGLSLAGVFGYRRYYMKRP